MEFDSHTSGVVAAAVGLVNALTPGWAHGRGWQPAGDVAAIERALAAGSRSTGPVTTDHVEDFAAYAVHLRQVFVYVDDGDMDAACEHVNALLRDTGAVPVLARHDGEPWHLHFHALDAPFPRAWAAAMATGLATVLGNRFADRLGVCSAPACDRVYVDTSRNGTRRFCSTTCQSRVKSLRYRQGANG